MKTKFLGVTVEKLLQSGGQTLYMLGWALFFGSIIGTILAILLFLTRKGGLKDNKIVYYLLNHMINIVRSVPFIILLVTIMPMTRLLVGTTIGSKAALVPPTVPAGMYSSTHSSLEEITQGAHIAVPNDASNTARAYALLQKAGWITLDPGVLLSAVTQDDIIENPYNLNITELKSLTIPASMQDFDYVIITGSIVYNAGIDASTALITEDILEHLILQVVVKEGNAETEWAQAIVTAYHSEEFKTYMAENNDGLWNIPDELK